MAIFLGLHLFHYMMYHQPRTQALCVVLWLARATWINLIDFVVRRLAESVSISGADIDFWSGLDQVDFWRFEIPLFIENCMMLINLSK
jgi:hypothetical protein